MTSCTWELPQPLSSLSTHESLSPASDTLSTDVPATTMGQEATDTQHRQRVHGNSPGAPYRSSPGTWGRQRLPQLDEKESLCSSKSLWRCLKSPSRTLQWLLQCDCHQGQTDGEDSDPGADSQADSAEKTGSDEPAHAMSLLLDGKHHALRPGLSMKGTTA